MTPGMMFLSLIFAGISMLVGYRLRSKFQAYSQIPIASGLTGREVAEKMLTDNQIYNVEIRMTEGLLSDHYNPADKSVNLSPDVYSGRNVAAAAVAAHECGHAVQHAAAYPWLGLRSGLVPVTRFSSFIVPWVLLAGVLLIHIFPPLLLGGIILFGVTTLFALVTLPVEFDASRRALAWMDRSGVLQRQEHDKAKDALWWAAMTYVAGALASVATLLEYVLIYSGGRMRD
ncbi:zinc metallopeptidase [Chitinophaga sp. 212800010-3]|uniref:zinc metallopeptidase n=1 Tax=unclassified Chitinophaga TaxID=2619133 RepID=UPI002DF2D79A|nr:Zinc metallopeptidase [Chitinophaga sp. 212800010-3]